MEDREPGVLQSTGSQSQTCLSGWITRTNGRIVWLKVEVTVQWPPGRQVVWGDAPSLVSRRSSLYRVVSVLEKSEAYALGEMKPPLCGFILFFFFLPCIMGSGSVEEADTTGQGFPSKNFQWTHLFIGGFVTSVSWPISFLWPEAKRPGLGSVPSEKNFKPQQARNLYREFAPGLFPHLQAPQVCLSFSLLPLVSNERETRVGWDCESHGEIG